MKAPRAARPIALAVTLMVAGWACSSNPPKDQFYGTDVGANWIPPDATARDAPVDAGAEDAAAVATDAQAATDAQIDAERDGGGDALDVAAPTDALAGDT